MSNQSWHLYLQVKKESDKGCPLFASRPIMAIVDEEKEPMEIVKGSQLVKDRPMSDEARAAMESQRARSRKR